jgi:hypothetical protein
MQMTRPLRACTDVDSVDNVLIYISDSLRFDATPTDVLELGVSGKAIAASTFTGSGYPSILTGYYPVTHGVWSLSETLPRTPHLLTVRDGSIDADNVWQNMDNDASKPPLRMCHVSESRSLADLDDPFVHVVHDFGGHMIYGGESARNEYPSIDAQLAAFVDDEDGLRDLYDEGVAESVDRFHAICDYLRDTGQWENTLVVFTSDHGEILGEHGGLYGHGSPMVPSVLEVPLVFAGAGIESGTIIGGVTSTVDVVPTALSALGENVPRDLDGVDLWSQGIPPERVVKAQVWRQTRYPGVEYRASSAWDAHGGVVRHGRNPLTRLAYTGANNLLRRSHARIVWKHMPSREFLRATAGRTVEYGQPATGLADQIVPTSSFTDDTDVPEPDVSGPTKEQLRELGYLD